MPFHITVISVQTFICIAVQTWLLMNYKCWKLQMSDKFIYKYSTKNSLGYVKGCAR